MARSFSNLPSHRTAGVLLEVGSCASAGRKDCGRYLLLCALPARKGSWRLQYLELFMEFLGVKGEKDTDKGVVSLTPYWVKKRGMYILQCIHVSLPLCCRLTLFSPLTLRCTFTYSTISSFSLPLAPSRLSRSHPHSATTTLWIDSCTFNRHGSARSSCPSSWFGFHGVGGRHECKAHPQYYSNVPSSN